MKKLFLLFLFLNLTVAMASDDQKTVLDILDVDKTCNTENEKKNAKIVIDLLESEVWWEIGKERLFFSDDFKGLHTSIFNAAATVPGYTKYLKSPEGHFSTKNYISYKALISVVNAREYYHNSFEQIICLENTVIVTSNFTGVYVNRLKKEDIPEGSNRKEGEVIHAVRYGSPVQYVFKLRKDELGLRTIYENTTALGDINLGAKARAALDKIIEKYPAPQVYCDEKLSNHKLGPKNKDKPNLYNGTFKLNPLGKNEDPYAFRPGEKQDHPLIECIDPSLTRTFKGIYKEFKDKMENAGFAEDGTPL